MTTANYSQFGFALPFAKWVYISEYDGLESPGFAFHKCIMDRIENFLDANDFISNLRDL
jgi:hypothetical protein